MSHFTVLVIGPDYEGQLAPFDESIQTEPRRSPIDKEDMVRMLEHYAKDSPSPKSRAGKAIRQDSRRRLAERGIDPETSPELDQVQIIITNQGSKFLVIEPSHEVVRLLWKEWAGKELYRDDAGYYDFTRYNEGSKWDWYSVGGRWTGYFKLKEGCRGRLGRPGVFDNEPRSGWVDQCLKRDVDIEAMRTMAVDEANAEWQRWHQVIDQHPPIELWETIRSRFTTEQIDQARTIYHSQPGIEALREAKLDLWGRDDILTCTREEWWRRACEHVLVPFAVLHNGQWFEKGRMGWWGISIGDKDDDVWAAEFTKLFDGLADETELTLVDCHI